MIELHLGTVGDSPTEVDTAIVACPDDYPAVRLRIRDAMHSGEDLRVDVRHRACDTWFWDLVDHPVVVIVDDDPREQLKRKLRIPALPQDLEDHPDWIVQLDVLDMPSPKAGSRDVWQWILSGKVGATWNVEEPSFEHLGALVEVLAISTGEEDQILREKMEEIIESWKAQATGRLQSAYQTVCDRDRKGAALFLICWANLGDRYGDTLVRWLEEDGLYDLALEWVASHLPAMALPREVQDTLSAKAEAYWSGRFAQDRGLSLDTAVEGMSGLLSGELRALQRHAVTAGVRVDEFELEMIRVKFHGVEGTSEIIERIGASQPPPVPSPPKAAWDATAWINWLRSEYFPYACWAADSGSQHIALAPQSAVFEEWLYKNYPQLLIEMDFLVLGTFRHIQHMLEEAQTVVWVLVDNLPIPWYDLLTRAMRGAGFILSDSTENPLHLFSMLPSETSVSRDSALLGQLPREVGSGEFSKRFVELWEHRGGRGITVSNSVDQLLDRTSTGGNLHLLIYTLLDALAHRPGHQVEDRLVECQFYLDTLARQLRDVVSRLSEIGDVRLVISSDHGSISLPKDSEKLEVPTSATQDSIFEEHRRFVRVENTESLSEVEWFILRADEFGLRDNYAAAKGHRHIGGTRPSGYTHGGLSPEETLVALSVWELEHASEVIGFAVSHTSAPILRGRLQTMVLTMRNPLSHVARDVVLVLPTVGASVKVDAIPGRTEIETGPFDITLPSRFPLQDGVAHVDATISYEVGGARRHQVLILPVRVHEIFKTELDDLSTIFE